MPAVSAAWMLPAVISKSVLGPVPLVTVTVLPVLVIVLIDPEPPDAAYCRPVAGSINTIEMGAAELPETTVMACTDSRSWD
jgi:hypothetical protein